MTENDKNNSELLKKDINIENNHRECVVNSSEEASASTRDEPLKKESPVNNDVVSLTNKAEAKSKALTNDSTDTNKESDDDEAFVFVDSDAPEEPNALERLTETIISDWQKRNAERKAEQLEEETAPAAVDMPSNFEIVTPTGSVSESEQKKNDAELEAERQKQRFSLFESQELVMLPIPELVVFPNVILPVSIETESAIKAVEYAIDKDRKSVV